MRAKIIDLDGGWNILLRLDEATDSLRMDVMDQKGAILTDVRILNARQLGWWITGQTEMPLGTLDDGNGK